MTLESTFERFRDILRSLGSPLANFKDYGNAWMIFRSMATVVSEQDTKLEELRNTLSLSTAQGVDLDARVSELFGITRNPGSRATGYILASSNSNSTLSLPSGTILTTQNNAIQIETTKASSLTNNVEIPIPVRALNVGVASNLNAGTIVTSNINSGISAVIGRVRSPLTSQVIGSLSGGVDPETDTDLRLRAGKTFGNSNALQLEGIIRDLVPEIGRVFIVEHSPVTGYITVYINSSESELVNSVEDVVDEYKAAGVAYRVVPLNELEVDIDLKVTVLSLANSQQALNIIRDGVDRYINNLAIGETLYKSRLEALSSLSNSIQLVECTNPQTNVTPASGQIISLGNLRFTIAVQ